jgi:hypothetical protein
MNEISEPVQVSTDGWATQDTLVREFVWPTNVSEALHETIADAVEVWPGLSETPPLAAFVDADKFNELVTERAVDDHRVVPSVRFAFQNCLVTVLYGSVLRVIVERDH